MKTELSAIIDISELTLPDRYTFVKQFLGGLIYAPKELWHHMMCYLDEAQLFCPESGKAESTLAVINAATLGRKRGLCLVPACQRISMLNKNVAAECLNKLIGRTGLDIDRARAGEELGFTTKEQRLSLRKLKPGEFYAFGPAISDEIELMKIGPVITTHPRPGRRITSATPTPAAIKKIVKELEGIPQEAEKDLQTKRQMQTEISRLQQQVRQLETANKIAPGATEKVVKKLMEAEAKIAELSEELTVKNKSIRELRETGDQALKNLIKIRSLTNILDLGPGDPHHVPEQVNGNVPRRISTDPARNVNPAHRGSRQEDPQRPPKNSTPSSFLEAVDSIVSGPGEKKILVAVGQFTAGLRREQLTGLTGYKRSSRDTFIQRLRAKALIAESSGTIMITDAGVTALGTDYEPLPTGQALQDHWKQRLSGGELNLFQFVLDAYPEGISREELSEKSGYQRSSRDTYLQRLALKEIITFPGRALVRASDILFT